MELALERLSPSFIHCPPPSSLQVSDLAGGAWKAAWCLGKVYPCRGSNLKVPGRGGKLEVTSLCSRGDNRLLNSTVREYYCSYQQNGFARRWRAFSKEQTCLLTTALQNSRRLSPRSHCSSNRQSSRLPPSPYHGHVPVLFAHDGKVCSWNKDEAQVLMARFIVRTPRMLSINPALA